MNVPLRNTRIRAVALVVRACRRPARAHDPLRSSPRSTHTYCRALYVNFRTCSAGMSPTGAVASSHTSRAFGLGRRGLRLRPCRNWRSGRGMIAPRESRGRACARGVLPLGLGDARWYAWSLPAFWLSQPTKRLCVIPFEAPTTGRVPRPWSAYFAIGLPVEPGAERSLDRHAIARAIAHAGHPLIPGDGRIFRQRRAWRR